MKVGIIGGGAIGLLFAYYFSSSGCEVTLYTRRSEQAENLNQFGLKLKDYASTKRVNVKASVLHETKKIEADLIVVAVKQYSLSGLAYKLNECVDNNQNLLFVQNGMGHINFINELDHENIYIGVVEHGVLKLSDSEINHVGKGITKIASFRGELKNISKLLDKVINPEFSFEYSDDWYQIIANKLLLNAVINPLTALYRVETGCLVENKHFQINMKCLFEEAFHILELKNKEEHWKYILNVCHNTAENRSSMLRDIESKKQTEIDAISGYLLQRAEATNKKLPYTNFVYESIKGMS